MILKSELSTKILAKIDRVDGSILELIESTLPLKTLSKAEFVTSVFSPGFNMLT